MIEEAGGGKSAGEAIEVETSQAMKNFVDFRKLANLAESSKDDSVLFPLDLERVLSFNNLSGQNILLDRIGLKRISLKRGVYKIVVADGGQDDFERFVEAMRAIRELDEVAIETVMNQIQPNSQANFDLESITAELGKEPVTGGVEPQAEVVSGGGIGDWKIPVISDLHTGDNEEQGSADLRGRRRKDFEKARTAKEEGIDVPLTVPSQEFESKAPKEEAVPSREVIKKIPVEKSENGLREERLKYLATGLVNDLRIFYGGSEVDKREATRRLEENKIKEITWVDGKKQTRKDGKTGSKMAGVLEKFFESDEETFFPDGWRDVWPILDYTMGISVQDLIVARANKGKYGVEKKEEKIEGPIWYEGIVKDLKDATNIASSDEVWRRAIENLRLHKVKFPKISTIKGDFGNWERMRIESATDFLDGKTNDMWVSKEAALKFLEKNLGVGRGGETVENKLTIDDERSKEEYFVGLMEMADPKKWNEMIGILKGLGAVDRDYGFGYLKVAYEWYKDPEKIKTTKGGRNLWLDTFAPILNKLGIKTDGIV